MKRSDRWDIIGWKRYAKALVALLAPALTNLATSLQDGVSGAELLRAGVAGILTSIIVWAVPNSET